MGYLEGLVESGSALRVRVKSVLPSLSRPCYASIFTGTSPIEHGITGNEAVRRLEVESVFDLLAARGRSSAVSGYYWMSELYQRAPFDRIGDREQDDNAAGITHGRYYFEDAYPDSHVFADAEILRRRHTPDLLVIHPMGVDDAGHRFGAEAPQYHAAAARIDALLAYLVPGWLADGYQVIVTADHGMNAFGFHGGNDDGVRITPFYAMGPRIAQVGDIGEEIPQTSLAHLICNLLGLPKADTMAPFPTGLLDRWLVPGSEVPVIAQEG